MAVMGDFMGGLGSFQMNFQMVALIFYLFIIVLAIVFAVWFVWMQLSYNYNILIIDKRGKHELRYFDKGKVIKHRDGTERFKLRKMKEKLPMPDFERVYITKGWLKKGLIVYYRYGEHSYTQAGMELDFTKDSANGTKVILKPIEPIVSAVRQQILDLAEKYDMASFFNKYGGMLLTLGGMTFFTVLFIIAILFLKEMMPSWISSMNLIADKLQLVADTLSNCQVGAAP
jgi:phage shock protein PspC (stress-responsive transcriptional regulator)